MICKPAVRRRKHWILPSLVGSAITWLLCSSEHIYDFFTKISRSSEKVELSDLEIFSTSNVCEGTQICNSRKYVTLSAINAWLNEVQHITIFVDNADQCGILPIAVRCVTHKCHHEIHHLPKVKCLLEAALLLSRARMIVYTNDDIVFKNISETARVVEQKFSNFLITGRRTNVLTDLVPDESYLYNLHKYPQVMASEVNLDYFVLKLHPSVFEAYPDFVIGNWRWDNCLLDFMILRNIPTIDATGTITALHLGKSEQIMQARPASKYNDNLSRAYREETKVMAKEIKRHICASNNNTNTNSARFGRISCCPFKTAFLTMTRTLIVF